MRDIHRNLARQFQDLSARGGDEKLRLLFADVAARERRFAGVVDDFEQAAGNDVLTTWLQFVPDDVVKLARDTAGIGQAASLAEAVERIQEVDRALGAAYREVAGETECGHLCELFRNLAQLEENHDRHLSKVMLGE